MEILYMFFLIFLLFIFGIVNVSFLKRMFVDWKKNYYDYKRILSYYMVVY